MSGSNTIAALFVESGGAYFGIVIAGENPELRRAVALIAAEAANGGVAPEPGAEIDWGRILVLLLALFGG